MLVCRNDVASATAVWHQVKEEVMEIHSKLERRTQLDKQVHPCQQCNVPHACLSFQNGVGLCVYCWGRESLCSDSSDSCMSFSRLAGS